MASTDSTETAPETVLITGGTSGLGLEAARDIATRFPSSTIVLASRSGEPAVHTLAKTLANDNIHYMKLDLSSLQEVRDFARRFADARYPPLTNVLLNAGLQVLEPQLSADNIEKTFAVNHLGHFLLFQLLRPTLAPNARITVTASGTHDPLQKTGMPDAIYRTAEELAHPVTTAGSDSKTEGYRRYTTSKLCNVLFTYALQSRLKDAGSAITVNAFDPGLMPGTSLAREQNAIAKWVWFNILPKIIPVIRAVAIQNTHSVEESGHALSRLATYEETSNVSGEYFEGLVPIKSSADSYDKQKQLDLWDTSVRLIAQNDEEIKLFNQF